MTAARLCGSSAEVVVYAIQVAEVDPMNEGLTSGVAEACVYVADEIERELKSFHGYI